MVGLLSFCSNLLTYLDTALLLWPFRCTKNNANSEAPFGSAVVVAACTSQNSPSETVWKFGMGPKSGLRKRPKGVEGVSIGRLLVPKKRSRDAFSYFPNSFSTHFGE